MKSSSPWYERFVGKEAGCKDQDSYRYQQICKGKQQQGKPLGHFRKVFDGLTHFVATEQKKV